MCSRERFDLQFIDRSVRNTSHTSSRALVTRHFTPEHPLHLSALPELRVRTGLALGASQAQRASELHHPSRQQRAPGLQNGTAATAPNLKIYVHWLREKGTTNSYTDLNDPCPLHCKEVHGEGLLKVRIDTSCPPRDTVVCGVAAAVEALESSARN
jgi:hypothetical protein